MKGNIATRVSCISNNSVKAKSTMPKHKNLLLDTFYVYIYYDPSRNNEPIYVGKGYNNRAWDHLNSSKRHPFVHRLSFMKKNKIFPVIGMYAGFDEEFAFLLETEIISKFGRKDLGKGTLLNLTDGGEGATGCVRSHDTRKKIGQANLGKDRTHTQASKDKISKSKSGVKDTGETRKRKSIAFTGKQNNNAKLTELDIVEIYKSDISNKILSTVYNVTSSHIWQIKSGRYWRSLISTIGTPELMESGVESISKNNPL